MLTLDTWIIHVNTGYSIDILSLKKDGFEDY